MSLKRSFGRFGARVGADQELIEGVLEGVDPALVAEVINGNTEFLNRVVSGVDVSALLQALDREVLREIIDQVLDTLIGDVALLDLDRVAELINALDYRHTGEMLMKVDPNILGIALGILLWSFRKATVAPGIFVADDAIETLDIDPDTIRPDRKRGR